MGNNNFDQRYPAMFQPGGEDHVSQQYFPQPPPEPDQQPQQPATSASVRVARAPVARTSGGQPEAAVVEQAVQVHEPDGDDELTPDLIHEEFAAPSPGRVSHWSTRSWIICGLAIVLVFAGSAFCFFATMLIPGSASLDPTAFHGVMVIPWGYVIFLGGPALLTAGLGMLAVMFLLAARHYPRRAWHFQAAAGLVGLVTLGLALMAVFSEQFFTELLYNPIDYQLDSNPLPWYSAFASSASQLLILGPAILALAVILHPDKKGSPGAATPKTTFWTGALITAAGVWAWFCPQLFPLARGVSVDYLEDQRFLTSPWTFSLSQAGGPIILVGSLVMFWWVLILATTHRLPEEDDAQASANASASANAIAIDGE